MSGRRWRFVAIGVAACVLGFPSLVVVSGGASADPSPALTIEGSKTTASEMQQWQAQFNELENGDVSYQMSKDVPALTAFANGTTDVASSDTTYAADGVPSPSQPYSYVPDVGYPETILFHVAKANGNPITNLDLDAQALGAIFTGAITRWNDPAIQTLNPTLKLPDTKIRVLYQDQASGDNYLLSDYLLQEDNAAFASYLTALGTSAASEPTATWPEPPSGTSLAGYPAWGAGDMQGVSGAGAAAVAVSNTADSISYAADSLGNGAAPTSFPNVEAASLTNAAGEPTAPTEENADAALAGASLNSDQSVDLSGVFGNTALDAYPLSGYSYLVIPCDPTLAGTETPAASCSGNGTGSSAFPAATGAELGDFVQYIVCEGGRNETLLGAAFAAIGAINGATEPSLTTEGTCPRTEPPEPQLIATGSSFVGVFVTQWEGLFNELEGGDVNFTVSSTTLGLNTFCQRTVDFAVTDLSYAAAQSTCSPSQVPYPYQYIPAAGGALGFEYNLDTAKGTPITDLVLDPATIAGIFTGSIRNWDDPALAALNPTVKLPNRPIIAYYRSDPSGENYLLSSYLYQTEPATISAFQTTASVPNAGQPSATWAAFGNGVPQDLNSLEGVNGSDAASQGPAQNEGGIAYVETAYAHNAKMPVAKVVNQSGRAVAPTPQNAVAGLEGATLNADSTANLTGVFTNPQTKAYPLASYSYFLTQCDPTAAAAQSPPTTCSGGSGTPTMGAAQGAELAAFVNLAVCLGQAHASALGYAPLPENLVQDAFTAIGRIPGATEPPPPTPQNCANPAIPGG